MSKKKAVARKGKKLAPVMVRSFQMVPYKFTCGELRDLFHFLHLRSMGVPDCVDNNVSGSEAWAKLVKAMRESETSGSIVPVIIYPN